MDLSLITHALLAEGQRPLIQNQIDWIEQFCKSPVFCDLHMTPVSNYGIYTNNNIGRLANYYFFTNASDAARFKLTWNCMKLPKSLWFYIKDHDGNRLARYVEGKNILDERIRHVQ